MPKVAVVILNWNGRNFLEKFLPSVISNSPGADIIVADNASTDDSIHFVQSQFPSVKIIKNSSNGGFSKGYNESLKQVDNQYYVLLNSDVEVTQGWLDPMLALLESDLTIAACQPKLLAYDDKSSFEYAGAAGGYIDKYGYPFCRGRICDSIEKDNGQYNNGCDIFWASGACLFIRADKYHEAGGLDEDFFAHMEEIDLCWRLKNLGYSIKYVPGSTVYHVGGGTLSKINPRKTFLNFRNNLYLITKNHPRKLLYWKLFTRLLLDGVAGIKFLLDKEPEHLKAVWNAHGEFRKNFRKMYNKRAANIPSHTPEVYDGSVVFEYFVKKKKTFSMLSSLKFSKR
jgi:GT2 family glycosyltransferase